MSLRRLCGLVIVTRAVVWVVTEVTQAVVWSGNCHSGGGKGCDRDHSGGGVS